MISWSSKSCEFPDWMIYSVMSCQVPRLNIDWQTKAFPVKGNQIFDTKQKRKKESKKMHFKIAFFQPQFRSTFAARPY